MTDVVSVTKLAEILHTLLKTDRDVTIGVSGMTGEGKSTFIIKLVQAYCKIADIQFTFDFLTWNRDELLTWIDGEGPEKKGRVPEYTPIVPDELFRMFYKRLWFEKKQIDAISVLNMCRDRHLFIIGAIPNFWHLDKSFITRVRFYCYVTVRGEVYVFQQENNPFTVDVWNIKENEKSFRKNKIDKSPNFLFKVNYTDLNEKEKEQYLAIRNKKRIFNNDEPDIEMDERFENLGKNLKPFVSEGDKLLQEFDRVFKK